jgi:hypothetical protein
MAARGQPDRVAPLALGQAQDRPFRQPIRLLDQKVVRRGAVGIVVLGVTFIPHEFGAGLSMLL